jgi:hypothetical protein
MVLEELHFIALLPPLVNTSTVLLQGRHLYRLKTPEVLLLV